MLKISYVQHTKYFKECWKFCALIEFPLFFKFEVRNFSKNAQNYAHSMYTILFFFFFLPEIVENYVYLMNTITQRIFIILYIQNTNFFEDLTKFRMMNLHNFLVKCWKFCAMNEHYYLKTLHNFVHLKYAMFKECSKFRRFKVHNISKKWWKFCIFNEHYY